MIKENINTVEFIYAWGEKDCYKVTQADGTVSSVPLTQQIQTIKQYKNGLLMVIQLQIMEVNL